MIGQNLQATDLRHGGKVQRITGIAHRTDRPRGGRSRDTWHYIGDVVWDNGKTSVGMEIAPFDLVSEDPAREIHALSDALSAYLIEHGTWCDRDSGHEGWYAHRPARKGRG